MNDAFPDGATPFPDVIHRDTVTFAPSSLRAIREAICAVRGVTRDQFLGHRRLRAFARTRQEACWLAYKVTRRSYPVIARCFGYADHTSVMFGVQATEARRDKDAAYALELDGIKATL